MKLPCWHCKGDMTWGGDHDCEEGSRFLIESNFTCPDCGTFALVYLPDYDQEPPPVKKPKKIEGLETCLEMIERTALVSEGADFYAMIARKGLNGEYERDPKS